MAQVIGSKIEVIWRGVGTPTRVAPFCIGPGLKKRFGKRYAEGTIPATRMDLEHWMKTLPQPWSAAMEATMFTNWIYDHLKPMPRH